MFSYNFSANLTSKSQFLGQSGQITHQLTNNLLG